MNKVWRDVTRKPRHGLRYVEQYAQAVVTAQPFPPRRFKSWVVCLRQVAPQAAMNVFIIIAIILIEQFVYRRVPLSLRPSSYFISSFLLLMGLVGVLWDEVLDPMYYWWFGLRSGQYAVARIAEIEQRSLQYGDVLEGQWKFVDHRKPYTIPFRVSDRESGTWVWDLAVGSEVHVLLHPTELEVLVAFGIVNEPAPNLHTASTQQLLVELLKRETYNDPSEMP